MPAFRYRDLVVSAAQAHDLDVELLEAQVIVESSGEPDAFHFDLNFYTRYVRTNPAALAGRYGPLAACSYGLLQVELETAYERGYRGMPHQLFDPAIGLEWGARQLAHLLAWAQRDYARALAAYNAGEGNVTAGQVYATKVFTQARVRG